MTVNCEIDAKTLNLHSHCEESIFLEFVFELIQVKTIAKKLFLKYKFPLWQK